MKKALSLILALVLCLSLCACGGKAKEVILNENNFREYLIVTIEVENFDEGKFSPEAELYQPTFDLVVTVKAGDPDYQFSGTSLKLVLQDEANPANLSAREIEITVDENGNGTYTQEDCSWMGTTAKEPVYTILTALSTVTGTATKN